MTWVRIGRVSTYPDPGVYPVHAPSPAGGYLATGDDFRVRVSPTGAEWTAVDGLAGVGESVDTYGGTKWVEVTAQAAFVIEVPVNAGRVLWLLRVEGGG